MQLTGQDEVSLEFTKNVDYMVTGGSKIISSTGLKRANKITLLFRSNGGGSIIEPLSDIINDTDPSGYGLLELDGKQYTVEGFPVGGQKTELSIGRVGNALGLQLSNTKHSIGLLVSLDPKIQEINEGKIIVATQRQFHQLVNLALVIQRHSIKSQEIFS